MTKPTALDRAVARLGGPQAFLNRMAISPRTLASWRKTGVPDTQWANVVRATGGQVSADELARDRAIALAGVE